MQKTWPRLLLSILLGVFTGCTVYQIPKGQVECPVCKQNGDLACLYVKPEESTPHIIKNGKAYYFCSEECKQGFLKQNEVN